MIAQPPRTRVRFKQAGLALWLVLFVLALAWRAQNLDAFSLSNDEGAHLMWARLAVDGYPLYSQTQAVQAPFFLEAVGWAFRLAGCTAQAGRWAMLVGFGLLAASLSWLAYRTGGWPAALAALLLVAVSPLVFAFSRLVMAEVPATGLAVACMALLFIYLDKDHKGWLLASGLALGLSFLTKTLNPFVVAPAGLLWWQHRRPRWADWPAWLAEGLVWAAGVTAPLVAVLFIYDPASLYDQLVAFRADLRVAVPQPFSERWADLAIFLSSHWGFWFLAFGGIMAAVLWRLAGRKAGSGPAAVTARFQYTVVWLAWLVGGLAMLAWHRPLFPHHFIVLLPPLILLGTDLVGAAAMLWAGTGMVPARRLWAWRGALVAVLLVPALNLPAMVRANRETAAIVTGGREAEAFKLLQAVSQPDDFIMGDSQQLIFMAGRRTPPPLGDVALVAVQAGRQTSGRMIRLTEEYAAPAVVQWSLRLPWLPDYLAWVETHYLARWVWDNDHIIYFVPRFVPGQPIPNEQQVDLGDVVTLRGYQLGSTALASASALEVRVYWEADAPLDYDYTIFTQLLDGRGSRVAGWDSQPLGGYFPTRRWPAHEIVTDVVRLPLPDSLPAGVYTLVTGWYRLDTMQRLRVPAGLDDAVILTTISVE